MRQISGKWRHGHLEYIPESGKIGGDGGENGETRSGPVVAAVDSGRAAGRPESTARAAPAGLAALMSVPSASAGLVTETPPRGLSSAEAAERRSRGPGSDAGERTSRPVTEILRANLLTRFNFIMGTLLAVILVVGPLQDAVFGIIVVANALVGIAQELRAKRTLDRLAVLSAPGARVIRDGARPRHSGGGAGARRPGRAARR